MTAERHDQQIFRDGSTTYYNSALLFPRSVREDVIRLYSFMRTADDYVDSVPQHINAFRNLVATWQENRGKKMDELMLGKDDSLNLRITKNICRLVIQYRFEASWVDAFLHAMELDTRKKTYHTLDDTLRYVHGSAEVIGLMMARVLQLPDEAMNAAALQGRAMQQINFVRDVAEDSELGRCYFPRTDLQKFGLSDLGEVTAKTHVDEFRGFVDFQLGRYRQWQRQADTGMYYIPRRYRLPIQTAVDSNSWTAKQIAKDPFVVYRYKVKPSKMRIAGSALAHLFD